MTLSALRDDALSTAAGATQLRLSLPWIRSLPVSSLLDPTVRVDGTWVAPRIVLGERRLSSEALTTAGGWWYLQDRVVFEIPDAVSPGTHEVSVSFWLEIPYLPGGPEEPLRLPFSFTRELATDTRAATVSRDVGSAA